VTTGNGKKAANVWSNRLMALPLWVVLAATAVPTMTGCGAAEAQRAKEAAAKRDDAERAAFVAELEAALTAKDIEKARRPAAVVVGGAGSAGRSRQTGGAGHLCRVV